MVNRYRDEFPGVLLGVPGLSPGGDVNLPQVRRMDEWRFAAQCADAIGASDWVGVHAYYVDDGADIDLKPDRRRSMARGRNIIITEGSPANGIRNDGLKLRNTYVRCEKFGFPLMAWLLSGAGAWPNADWVAQNVRIP
ncbi:MAG: hypothetical protein KJ065_14390 [Anaerolineae bacterium]|nr:hypothetical protein [Anaerolineae bacterium]